MTDAMTVKPFAALLDGAVARGWCHPANAHKQMDPDLAQAITSEVLATLAAAVPADLAEAGKVLERLRASSKGLREFYKPGAVELIPSYTMDDAADTITALLARIAAQEAQMVSVLQREAEAYARHDAKLDAAETALAAMTKERDRFRDAAASAANDHIAQHKMRVAAETALAAERAKVAKLVEALTFYSCKDGCNDCSENERDLSGCGWTARAAITEAGQ